MHIMVHVSNWYHARVFQNSEEIKRRYVKYGPFSKQQRALKSKLKLIYDWQSVRQSVLVSGTHLGPATNFSFFLESPLDSCGFVML
jgi:hypothetical protein